jgi:tetratricopeptide (TPR) repeat protein
MRAMRIPRVLALAILVTSPIALAGKLEPDDLPGPAPEVANHDAKIEPPAVPTFELPAVEPGFHGARELHVRGAALLGTELKVQGFVTAIYDCAAELAVINPSATRAQIRASIAKDPSLCGSPKLYLGDAKDTPRDASIWVVDVPASAKVARGDFVAVTGAWATQSPHNERNADGLVVVKAIERAAPPAAAAVAAPASEPEITVVTRPPQRAAVDDKVRNDSIGQLNACNKAIAARKFDDAVAACKTATTTWDGNHFAWYSGASAHMARAEWPEAKAGTERAVALRPDQAMYQLYYGIALYESELARVRAELAARDHKPPQEVAVNPSMLKLDGARDALRRAAKLAPELWRAHFYLGRVYRDLGDSQREAEQFTQTITVHPAYRFAYIALIELYRRWGFLDQAIAVALIGTTHVAPAEVGELWYEAGMAYDAKHADDPALDAFTKAITARPDDVLAKLGRGQIYFRRADLANAKRDLDDVVKSADPRVAAARSTATALLAKIAHRQR